MGDDLIDGNAAADAISDGGAGNDTLNGGDGDDVITGTGGTDTVDGGAGADRFFFATGDSGATFATADRIQGFSSAQGDRIDLSQTASTSYIGSAAFSNSAGEVRSQLINGNTYVMGDVDGDAVADYVIRLDGTISLSASDFAFGAP